MPLFSGVFLFCFKKKNLFITYFSELPKKINAFKGAETTLYYLKLFTFI